MQCTRIPPVKVCTVEPPFPYFSSGPPLPCASHQAHYTIDNEERAPGSPSLALIGCQLNRLEFGGCAFPKISSLGLVFF